MGHLLQDLRIATRALLHQRGFTLTAVLTLGLGVGATTAIFSVVHGVLLRPLPYPESGRLVAIGQTQRSNPTQPVGGSVSRANFLDWQRESRTVARMALYSSATMVVTNLGDADVVAGAIVSPDFFETFKSPPLIGRTFTEDEDRRGGPDAIVVSHSFWRERLGGRADVLSAAVEVSGRPRPIVGVAPPGFEYPRGAHLYMPIKNNEEQCGRGCVYLNGIGRLAEGASVDTAQQEMSQIAATLERDFPDANTDVTVMVETLQDRTVGSVKLALAVLLSAVLLVLLIACANVANLLLVRGSARHAELAVRAALGANRRRILSYLLTENLVLGICGGGLGLILAWWGIDALRAVAPPDLPRLDDVRFDLPTFLFASGMVFVTTLIFGLGPSLRLTSGPLLQALGQRGAVGHHRQRWTRSTLLAAEVGLSLVLLLGAGLLLRSLSALQREELGFQSQQRTTFMVSLPAARYPAEQVVQRHEQLDEELEALPGVSRVARISELPLADNEITQTFTRPDLPPPPPGQAPVARLGAVDPDYFPLMGIPLLAGRNFEPNDRAGTQPAVIINQRMAEVFWPGEHPVGRPIAIGGGAPGVVIGVVGNVRSTEIAILPQPEMFVPHAQAGNRSIHYILQSSLPSADIMVNARRVVQRMDPRLPLINPGSLGELVEQQLGHPQFYVTLLGLFAAIASMLAAVGIYGVVAYAVTQRRREIGVRMALGARRTDVVRLLLWQGLRPAALGLGFGLLASMATGQVMRGLLYETQPHDPITLVGVTFSLLVVVAIASAIPARRASAVPPAEAFRAE